MHVEYASSFLSYVLTLMYLCVQCCTVLVKLCDSMAGICFYLLSLLVCTTVEETTGKLVLSGPLWQFIVLPLSFLQIDFISHARYRRTTFQGS